MQNKTKVLHIGDLSRDEPVQQVLLGLPVSLLERLDDYALSYRLSRVQAIDQLLNEATQATESMVLKHQMLLEELKQMLEHSKQPLRPDSSCFYN